MLPSIHFKAEFVRHRMDPLKGARSVIHMDENLSYLSPSDSIIYVNENHKLVVEKVLSGPDFAKLIHDISDLAQEVPDRIKRQPQSLLYTASFAAAQKLNAEQAKNQPLQFVEATACHLPPEEIVDFLRINKFGIELHETFTRDGFQRFLLHVFKTCEKPTLTQLVEQDLKNAELKLSRNLFKITEEAAKNNRPFLWHLVALGCFSKITQFCPHNIYEFTFYTLKFHDTAPDLRYPIPDVPYILSRIVPEKDTMDLPPVDPVRTNFIEGGMVPPADTREHFFLLLCAFAEARWRGCHHEVFAYAMHIMANEKFMQDPLLEKYQLHLWGGLAVSLAKIHAPEIYALSCLEKAKEFVKCHSHALDLLLMKQQIMAAFERSREEEACFQEMMKSVPMCSAFHRQSVLVHMSFKTKELEDRLLEIWSRRQQLNDASPQEGFHGISAIVGLEYKFRKECFKYKKWIFKLCSTAPLPVQEYRYQAQVALMDCFIRLCYRCGEHARSDADFKRVMHNLWIGVSKHLKPLLAFLLQEDSFEAYYSTLQSLKKKIQEQTKTMNPLPWADVCYIHFIVLKIFQSVVPEIIITELYEAAYTIYKNNNHPRAERLECWVRDKRQYRRPAFDESVHKFCSIVWIAKTAPRVKALIRHGVSSATKFDLPNTSYYWHGHN